MLVDTLPARLAFWLGRPPRLDAIPAPPDHQDAPAPRALSGLPLRPAMDLETRLMLRDRGWAP